MTAKQCERTDPHRMQNPGVVFDMKAMARYPSRILRCAHLGDAWIAEFEGHESLAAGDGVHWTWLKHAAFPTTMPFSQAEAFLLEGQIPNLIAWLQARGPAPAWPEEVTS